MSSSTNANKRLKTESSGGGAGNTPSVLLIIDPQNDFSDSVDGVREQGSLFVEGSSADYQKIINFMRTEPGLSEIHVSLDTHTDRHIGHPAFWDVKRDEKGDWEPATDDIGFTILNISSDDIITGVNIFDAIGSKMYFRPRMYDAPSYPDLCKYVNEYLHFYDRDVDGNCKSANKKGQFAWIWKNHCLEETSGHKIAAELQTELDLFAAQPGKSVRYHIKGQNNLAEMYSIFSAECPVKEEWYEPLKSYMYTGLEEGQEYDNKGLETYEAAMKSKNVNTNLNTDLMDQLLGTHNKVFVCGQARTHCVKSSAIDLMTYAEKKRNRK